MAYTQDDYDALKSAIASGATRVEYGDKRIEYRSLAEMKTILADMAKSLGFTTRTSGRTNGNFSKGL
jgi:hypothetical protein